MTIKKLIEKIKTTDKEGIEEYLKGEDSIYECLKAESLELVKKYAKDKLSFTLNEYCFLMNKLYGEYEFARDKEECRFFVLMDYIEDCIYKENNKEKIVTFREFKKSKVEIGKY